MSEEGAAMSSSLKDRKDISLHVEWSDEAYVALQSVMNKVVVDAEYSKWKEAKAQSKGNRDSLRLYDCLDAYVSKETLGENDLWCCFECKKRQMATKKLDLWSPEIILFMCCMCVCVWVLIIYYPPGRIINFVFKKF